MRIAIYGLAKTGTSALYYKLMDAMPANTIGHFEPDPDRERRVKLQRYLNRIGIGRSRPMVVKLLIAHPSSDNVATRFGTFDKSILITRDPRDRLISGLLYRAYATGIAKNPKASEDWIKLLEQKERNPRSISVIELIRQFHLLADNHFDLAEWRRSYDTNNVAVFTFADRHPELFRFRYEDLIDQNFAALNAYLGLQLSGRVEVSDKLSRVVRTRGYGNWRDWFTRQDVEEIGPLLQPYLDRYYPDAEWSLNSQPSINSEHASGYVRRLINESRVKRLSIKDTDYWRKSP